METIAAYHLRIVYGNSPKNMHALSTGSSETTVAQRKMGV